MIIEGLENIKNMVKIQLERPLTRLERERIDALYNGKAIEIGSVRVEHIKGTLATMNIK